MLCAVLNIRMVTWKYLNFQVKVRLNSRIFSIEEKIRAHHGGSVHQVFLYQGVVAPENLLSDPSLTLYDDGFEGDIEGLSKNFKGNFYNYLTYLKGKYQSSIVF